MRVFYWPTVAVCLTIGLCALLVANRLPLGVTGQWEWGRWEHSTSWADWLTSVVLSIAYVAGAALGARWVSKSRWATGTALLGLVLAGFAVQMVAQQLGFGLGKWAFVLYSPSSSGYYTAAKRDVRSASQFLADYGLIQQSYLQEHGPLHLATHPPGLVLLHYASLRLCESNAALTRLLRDTQPQPVADGFREVASKRALAAADQSSIWLVGLLTQLASSLVVMPIYALARRCAGSEAAWWCAALWPVVPAATIFIPKSDALYPLFAATTVALAVSGRTYGRGVAGFLAGIVLCVGMFFSFGLIAVVPLAATAAVLTELSEPMHSARRAALRLSCVALGFAAAVLIFWAATGHSLLETWWRCYRYHASFYDPGQTGANRTYWPWVGVNLVEFFVAAGVPIMVAAVAGTGQLLQGTFGRGRDGGDSVMQSGRRVRLATGASAIAVSAGWLLVLLMLNFSGKNRGEIARLWMFLMPFACVAAAPAIEQFCTAQRRAVLAGLLLLQAGQTVAFAASVQGFYDPSSVGVAARAGDEWRGALLNLPAWH